MRKLIAANWKMYKVKDELAAFIGGWSAEKIPSHIEAAVFPPFTLLETSSALISKGPGNLALGAQNCCEHAEGAYTGEISCRQILDCGCKYVLIGHSERRHIYGESDERLALKFAAAIKSGLRPVLCVGEKLEQREAGKTIEIVLGQLEKGLGGAPPKSGFDIAYEPVWAIGTGRVAKPEDAAEVHLKIIDWMKEKSCGEDARVLYGGSAKPDNAGALLAVPSVHGLLVGGASLDPRGFADICRASQP